MIEVRSGRQADVPAIVEMAERFWKHTIYKDEIFCSDSTSAMISLCLDQNLVSVLAVDDAARGFACGVKGALLANVDVVTGTEVAWWVDPEHRKGRNGVRLLRHLEGLAKEAGIKYWSMVLMLSSMPEGVARLYDRIGYSKNEVAYTKVL